MGWADEYNFSFDHYIYMKPLIQRVLEALSLGLKQSDSEAGHSLLSSAEFHRV
jgi:hypothetical protein